MNKSLSDADMIVYYDGLCPICRREMMILKKKARDHSVGFCDFTDREFDPQSIGRTEAELAAQLHVYDRGRWIVGMDALRALYNQVGLGKWINWTALPGIRIVCDWGYGVFARFRPRLSGASGCSDSQCG